MIQHPFDPVLVSLYKRSLAIYRDLAWASSGEFRLPNEPAGLLLIGTADVAAAAAEIAAAWTETYPDARPEIVAGQSLCDLEPALAPDLVACRLEIGYPVAPASATRAFAKVAEARGATVRIGADVALALSGGEAVGVEVDGRVEPAGAVVVAAGPWTPALVDPSGEWRPIRSSWGVVAQVDLAEPPGHVLEAIDIEIEPASEPSERATVEGGLGFSLVTADGASALGSTFLPDEPRPEAFASCPPRARARATYRRSRARRSWACAVAPGPCRSMAARWSARSRASTACTWRRATGRGASQRVLRPPG